MLGMSWAEIVVVGIVMIIVVSPRDLPNMLRSLGAMVSRMRAMASDFQNRMNGMIQETYDPFENLEKDFSFYDDKISQKKIKDSTDTPSFFKPSSQEKRTRKKSPSEKKPLSVTSPKTPASEISKKIKSEKLNTRSKLQSKRHDDSI